LTVTEVPPREIGSGVPDALDVETARFAPKILAIDPGEIGWE